MSNKPRTKKYNPNKRVNLQNSATQRLLQESFKYMGITCNLLDSDLSELFLERPIPKLQKKTITDHLFNHKHMWTVYGAVCFIEANGKHKLKVIELAAPFPVIFMEIAATTEAAHKEFLYSFSKEANRICGYGFVAYAADVEKSDEVIMEALEKAGCFSGDYQAAIADDGSMEFYYIKQ